MMDANVDEKLWKWSKEAYHYTITKNGVKCLLCPNGCVLENGKTGVCHNRVNNNGKLYSIAYGNPCAVHVDPIEKKPLMHFLPGEYAYSLATAGCNLGCLNCQNADISQSSPYETANVDLSPEQIVYEADKKDCKAIAYTYSEPITFYEYMFDTAKIARERGIKNILVSNGYINEEPLRQLCKFIDAANINLKSFDNNIYLKLNACKLEPILNTLKVLKSENVWLEITNLIVPEWTDDLDMIKRMCAWLYENGFSENPLHFSRFHPTYKLPHLPPTPVEILYKAKEIAISEGIKYVYVGNVSSPDALNTYCSKCKSIVLERIGYKVVVNRLKNGCCYKCGEVISGVWW
jgi:pyruvate formate lyase activating enzyme